MSAKSGTNTPNLHLPDLRPEIRIELLTPQLVQIDSIKPHPQNPNRGDVDAIAESLGEFGQFDAVTVQASSRYLITGNHTHAAARAKGYTEIAAVLLDVDDRTALRMMVAHNRLNRIGRDDSAQVAEILAELLEDAGTPYVLMGTGYDEGDLTDLLLSLQAADAGEAAAGSGDAPDPAAQAPMICQNCGYDVANDRDRFDDPSARR